MRSPLRSSSTLARLQLLAIAGATTGALLGGCSSETGPADGPAEDPRADEDGDGVPDQLGSTKDEDGDGEPDLFDVDMDGTPDGIGVDIDGDGEFDGVAVDEDGDGKIDGVDTDGDGKADVVVKDPPPSSGSGGNNANGGSSSSGGQEGNEPDFGPWTPGIAVTPHTSLPNNEPVACEWDWFIGHFFFQRNTAEAHSPRRMYSTSCNTDSPSPRLYTSLTIGEKEDSGLSGVSGVITVSDLNPETGAVEVKETHHFPECRSMHGIATAGNCGTVAALCRIENTASGADYDAVAGSKHADWMTNENRCGNEDKMNDHMWLYEWADGDLTKTPTKVIVHKSIGSWEYGSNYLRYGEEDNSYGIGLKATVGKETDCHEADSYMVLSREDYSFMDRGWEWACATGHTIHNRPAYDPTTKKYAMLCSTDYNNSDLEGENEIAFRMEDGSKLVVHYATGGGIRIKGGAGPLIPREGGGFLGVVVGDTLPRAAVYDYDVPSEIGVIAFDAKGAQVGEISWVEEEHTGFYGWPQLAPLGGDRYLLAWGEAYEAGSVQEGDSVSERNNALVIPRTFWMKEIDGSGKPLTAKAEVTDAGWGETNEMIPLGNGRVAWSFVPDDRRDAETGAYPSCNQDLNHYVYTSATEPAR